MSAASGARDGEVSTREAGNEGSWWCLASSTRWEYIYCWLFAAFVFFLSIHLCLHSFLSLYLSLSLSLLPETINNYHHRRRQFIGLFVAFHHSLLPARHTALPTGSSRGIASRRRHLPSGSTSLYHRSSSLDLLRLLQTRFGSTRRIDLAGIYTVPLESSRFRSAFHCLSTLLGRGAAGLK